MRRSSQLLTIDGHAQTVLQQSLRVPDAAAGILHNPSRRQLTVAGIAHRDIPRRKAAMAFRHAHGLALLRRGGLLPARRFGE